ncbi:MAG TPA: hypothetical protein VM425_06075 [Myxococcota bacterium]|nr:hypothetical protein [Myxococcota bacterium]
MKVKLIPVIAILASFATMARADLPTGYLVWTKGEERSPESRKIYRMTLPEKSDIKPLTSGTPGEDIECQISPDGKWVAYAKAKLPGQSYHQTKMWKLYIVSIHGIGDGREEIKIDDNGYWPSWGEGGEIFYSQVDEEGGSQHTRIMRVTLDEYGAVQEKVSVFSTREHFAYITDMNECFMAPDGSWFAARTRGEEAYAGVGAVSLHPPAFHLLAKAGSVGCMPCVAPSGDWGLIAGRDHGIRWGEAPDVPNRQEDQLLIPPFSDQDLCYHPGISSDEKWALASHSTDDDHNAGPYDLYIYALDSKTAGEAQLLAGDGFNGWPDLWVGQPSDPPPPRPHIDSFAPDRWTIETGGQVQLAWQTSFADQVTLDSQPVEVDGGSLVTPTSSTTYRLLAESNLVEQSDSANVEIVVNPEARAVTIDTFTLSPDTIVTGDSAILEWSVSDPYQLDINGQPVAPTGSIEVSPVATTDYVLTVGGHEGPVSRTLTLTVTELKQGLDDRGGCFCGFTTSPGGLAALGLLLLWFSRRRRTRA